MPGLFNGNLEPPRVRAAWLLPYVVLGLFVAVILALLWFVHCTNPRYS